MTCKTQNIGNLFLLASIISYILIQSYVVSSVSFVSIGRSSNNIDDGFRNVIQFKESPKASKGFTKIRHRVFLEPNKRIQLVNKMIASKQRKTNEVGTGLEAERFDRAKLVQMLRQLKKPNTIRFGIITKRTVESPSLSVDSGGQSKASLSSEIARLFNAEPHYFNFYHQIDHPNHKNASSTKRPADVIEELMRNEATQIYRLQEEQERRQQQKSQRHNN